MNIEIHEEKNCAWCFIDGTFLYGRDADEVRDVLDKLELEVK